MRQSTRRQARRPHPDPDKSNRVARARGRPSATSAEEYATALIHITIRSLSTEKITGPFATFCLAGYQLRLRLHQKVADRPKVIEQADAAPKCIAIFRINACRHEPRTCERGKRTRASGLRDSALQLDDYFHACAFVRTPIARWTSRNKMQRQNFNHEAFATRNCRGHPRYRGSSARPGPARTVAAVMLVSGVPVPRIPAPPGAYGIGTLTRRGCEISRCLSAASASISSPTIRGAAVRSPSSTSPSEKSADGDQCVRCACLPIPPLEENRRSSLATNLDTTAEPQR